MATAIVDDTNHNISYTGEWATSGTSFEYNSTTHGTSAEGAQAVYSFTGSLIEVYGTIGRENNGDPSFAPTSTYTIDNNLTVSFTGQIGNVTLYRQIFFASQGLQDGQIHTLVISYKTPGKNPLWLDYFRVTDTSGSATILPASSLPSSPSSSSSSPTQNQPTPTSSPSSSVLSTGAIVGIAIGGSAALLLLVIILFLIRSLSRSPKQPEDVAIPLSPLSRPPPQPEQGKDSWLDRLWKHHEHKPPGELHPFRVPQAVATSSHSRSTNHSRSTKSSTNPNSVSVHHSQNSISASGSGSGSGSGGGIEAIYRREAGRYSIRGTKSDEKKASRISSRRNARHAPPYTQTQGPLLEE